MTNTTNEKTPQRKIDLDSYEHPELDITHVDGNAYSVIAAVVRTLAAVKEVDTKALIKQYSCEVVSEGYNNLLKVSMEYVKIL